MPSKAIVSLTLQALSLWQCALHLPFHLMPEPLLRHWFAVKSEALQAIRQALLRTKRDNKHSLRLGTCCIGVGHFLLMGTRTAGGAVLGLQAAGCLLLRLGGLKVLSAAKPVVSLRALF